MTSELSNALNPLVAHTRSRTRSHHASHADLVHQHVVEQTRPRPHVPHRSELELAIAEPPPAPPPPPQPPVPTLAPPAAPARGANAVHELVRIIAQTKQAHELERKRRIAWEQEQQARFAQREAELEQQLLHMQEELALLKSYVALNASPLPMLGSAPTPPPAAYIDDEDPAVDMDTYDDVSDTPPSPSSPVSPFPFSQAQTPAFVEGSSTLPMDVVNSPVPPEHTVQVDPPPEERSPTSPMSATSRVQSNEPVSRASTAPPNTRKRPTPAMSSSSDDDDSRSERSSSSDDDRPRKRVNGHDTRCLTIHHAMRAHILRCMNLKHDKELPDSHNEADLLSPESPMRFVWDKTPKQSLHNGSMKARVIADIKAKRRLYKDVPEKDFNKKTLETVFDQAFTTFRQKFKAQRDTTIATNHKRREDIKTARARRHSRKKIKLKGRTETRKKMEAFAHPTFDGAFQQECMSSEESCSEYVEPSPSGAHGKVQVLRTRGLPWRSTRLLQLYASIDEEEKVERSFKPKRGVGRKERFVGPAKDGFYMPPKGVASWMVSQRWIREMQIEHPDLLELLKDRVVDPPGFDWNEFDGLGVETEEEHEEPEPEPYIPRSDTSSLAHALAPV